MKACEPGTVLGALPCSVLAASTTASFYRDPSNTEFLTMLEISHQHIPYHTGLESWTLRIGPNSGLFTVHGYPTSLSLFIAPSSVFATIVLSFPLSLMRIISFSKFPRANQILSPGVFAKILNPVSWGLFFPFPILCFVPLHPA